MKVLSLVAAFATAFVLMPEPADAQVAKGKTRVVKPASGGKAVGQSRRAAGPNGAASSRRGAATDGQGNAAAGRSRCAGGANGAGCAGSKTTKDADGNVSRNAGRRVETQNGQSTTRGSFNRNADGSYSGERSTDASGQKGSVTGNTTVNSETGFTKDRTATGEDGSVDVQSSGKRGEGGARKVTCSDASGNTVDCPTP